MKKFIIVLFVLFTSHSVLGQFNLFDSVYTLISSPIYDYTNPTFEFIKNDLNAWSYLAYERHKAGGGSDIIARKVNYAGYGTEFVITNSATDENINPVILDSIVFWQSNKNGNWDIYYSSFNGSTWSAPKYFIGNTSQDDVRPYFVKTYFNNDELKYLLVLQKGPDIFLHKLRVLGDTWDTTGVNVTDTVAFPCSYPVITAGNPNVISFFKSINVEAAKYNSRKLSLATSGVITWTGASEMDTLNVPQKITPSYSSDFYPYLLINSGQNVRGLYSTAATPSTMNFTPNIAGQNGGGKGILMGLIFDSPDLSPVYFSAFSCITKRGDSTFVSLSNNYSVQSTNTVKQKFVGTGAVTTKMDISIPLSYTNLYKMRAVWEKNINGKIALVESYAINGITSIVNQNNSVEYSLMQNYPNPFNPSTRINYELKIANYVSLKVFDLLGKEVALLVNEKQNAGSYAVDFNSTEFNLPSGIYFYTLKAGDFNETKKMVLVK